MKRKVSLTALLIAALSVTMMAQNVEVQKFEMSIAGTSTLHDWESEVTEMTLQGQFQMNGTLAGVQNLEVEVPVLSIKSTKGSKMDKKTYDAFDAENHPMITYKLQEIESIQHTDNTSKVKAKGLLTMAGTSKLITMTVDAKQLAGGQLELMGSKELNMVEFNMDPPRALFGTIKTGEDVTIKFKVTLKVQDQ